MVGYGSHNSFWAGEHEWTHMCGAARRRHLCQGHVPETQHLFSSLQGGDDFELRSG